MASIGDRIQAVEDKDEIRELTARYCYGVARGDTEGVVSLFCDDGVVEMPDRVLRGHDELRQAYGRAAPQLAPKPFIQNHVIELDGDRATGLCAVEVRVVQDGEAYTAAGHYEDTYRRVSGEWKFARRYLVIYHWVPLSKGWATSEPSGPPTLD